MSNLRNIEIELKFPLNNYEGLIKKLDLVAKSEKKEDFQKDIYYVPEHKNFIESKPISEWLRIRETKKGVILNYKRWHNKEDKKAVSCDEFQTTVGNLSALKGIFENLGLTEIIIVEKVRSTWSYKDVKISIDDVKELGFFIEIEAKGTFSDVKEAKEYLYSVLKELDVEVGQQDFKGYPHRMLERKGVL